MSSSASSNQSGPLFVVGIYRSGTTLVYALVNQHPKVALMYECDSLAIPVATPNAKRWPRWAERNELWNRVFTRHRIDPLALDSCNLRALYSTFARRSGAVFYGEKSPAYCRWLPKLIRNFPDARLIIVLRELPEIYQSIRDAGKLGSRFFRRKGQLPRLLWSHRRMIRAAHRLEVKSVPVFRIRYREAVSDTPGVARRICQFLGIEFDEAMSSLIGADLSAIYRAPHHDQVRSDKIVRRAEGRAEISPELQRDLRMFAQESGQTPFVASEKLPPLSLSHRVRYLFYLGVGWLLCTMDDAKRVLYEYLPISWFRGYRRMRSKPRTETVGIAKGIGQRPD